MTRCRLLDHERGSRNRRGATAATAAPPHPTFWIAAYPAAGLAFHKILSLAHLADGNDVRVRGVAVPYFALDQDVLTLHRPTALKEAMVDGDFSILHEMSQARALDSVALCCHKLLRF